MQHHQLRAIILPKTLLLLLVLTIVSCTQAAKEEKPNPAPTNETDPAPVSLILLGNVQDAGSPQVGCTKSCCADLFAHPEKNRKVVSLGLVDRTNGRSYLFEATPDLPAQLKLLADHAGATNGDVDGIFLTHAHIGHYTGLMYLGKESMDANALPVYAMPKMRDFLAKNGPWDQLVKRKNVSLKDLSDGEPVALSPAVTVTPLLVPHRDEYSETVGYRIEGPNKSALFIPDIDKWEKWENNINEEIALVDYAFLDATFYSGEEINNRDIREIPHPFVIESLDRFKGLDDKEKRKIVFIHFNHTNPLLNENSSESQTLLREGFGVGRTRDVFAL